MPIVTLDANGLYEEAKKNHKSEIGVNYTKEDLTLTWNTVADYINEIMKSYCGVEIPNLGTFTFQTDGGYQWKPCFKVSRVLSHMYQVSSSDIKIKDIARVYKINEASIADKMSKHYQLVSVCIKEVLQALQRLLSQGKDVDFPFTNVCVLQFRKGIVKTVFQKVYSQDTLKEKGDAPVVNYKEKENVGKLQTEYVPVMGAVVKTCSHGNTKKPQNNSKQTVFKNDNVEGKTDNTEEKNSVKLPINPPLGSRPSVMNLTYFDSENPPVVIPPSSETFFQMIPITQFKNQYQVEVAIGECRENAGKVVCNKCAQSLEKGYICEFAAMQQNKAPEVECQFKKYPPCNNSEHVRRNKEAAEFNKQMALQKMKAPICQDDQFSNDLFENRPPTTQNVQREINYRQELKNTVLQRQKEQAAEHELENLKEQREVELMKKQAAEDEMKEKCYIAQREKEVAEKNKHIIQQHQRLQEHEKKIQCQHESGVEDPHLLLHYHAATQGNENQSKVNQLKTTMCNLQLQAYKCQKQIEEKCKETVETKNAMQRVEESLNEENTMNGIRRDFQHESLNDWKKQIQEKESKKKEERENDKEPVLDLLDQLYHIKRCNICKKDLNCTD